MFCRRSLSQDVPTSISRWSSTAPKRWLPTATSLLRLICPTTCTTLRCCSTCGSTRRPSSCCRTYASKSVSLRLMLPLNNVQTVAEYFIVCVCVCMFSDHSGECEANLGFFCYGTVGGGNRKQEWSEGDWCFWRSHSLHRTLHQTASAAPRFPRYQQKVLITF